MVRSLVTDFGSRPGSKPVPSLVEIRKAWSMKSKSIWKLRSPSGMGEVVSPRALTYSATCQE